MNTTIDIQKASKNDFGKACTLLREANLPTRDLNPLLEHFFIAIEDNKMIAVMGMDKYGKNGLLRSAIVKTGHRGSGIASALLNQLHEYAKQQEVSTLYLITNTAEKYFEKRGFHKISRDKVPETVLQSKEFNGLCPSSSVIMTREL